MKDIEYPVSLNDIKKIEKRIGISINVYAYKKVNTAELVNDEIQRKVNYDVYPLLITDSEKDVHVDLLYITAPGKTHYCYIKNLSRLVHSQITKDCRKIHLCKRCLLHFGREDLLLKHKEDCDTQDPVKIELPEKGSVLKFDEHRKKMKVPFVMYADFECMLEPISNCAPSPNASYTVQYQHHVARSFSLYTTCAYDDYSAPITYFGKDAGKKFVETLKDELEKIDLEYKKIVPMKPLTEEQQKDFLSAVNCHICDEELFDDRVKNHNHGNGEYLGVCHNACNLQYRIPRFVPLFIHNLTGYDTHLFVKMLRLDQNTSISVIPNNEEKYISYTVDFGFKTKVRFLDSVKFTLDSLDSLAKNLKTYQFKHTLKYTDSKKLHLLITKGVYPYDHLDSDEKYNETQLPPKEAFYNKLNKCHISDKDYEHALNVWKTFEIKDLKEYTLLYNKTDVLLLADVMETFRDFCLEQFKLDPAWYLTIPGYAWSAMLRYTKIELELLSDYDMILFVNKGIRGGMSQCSNRYAKANNPYMGLEYNSDLPTTYIIYLDAVNLYGWAQTQPMPYGGFEWCDTDIDVMQIDNESPVGYILEVDLEYPKSLHDLHSEYPLAPEKRAPPGAKEKKLLTTFYDKEKYVIHYWNLKLYLSLGMKLKKIHRVLKFKQSHWLKMFIDSNLELWREASNRSDKQIIKLINCSIYGKSVQDIRNYVDIRLATQQKQIDKWIARPNFKSRTIFSENLTAVHMRKQKLFFNKPTYIGFCILEISKTLMYDFHYNFFKQRYPGNKSQLQYGDTDSLEYLVETENVYDDMKETLDRYDTSNFDKLNRYGMPRVNKKKLGAMKDEFGGRVVYEYVGLRSKMYSNRAEAGKKSDDQFEYLKKAKGVKKSVVKNEIHFTDYKKCLFEQVEKYKSMNQIRSVRHELYSVEMNKKVLSHTDDKRHIFSGGIKSLPWGHYDVPDDKLVSDDHGDGNNQIKLSVDESPVADCNDE